MGGSCLCRSGLAKPGVYGYLYTKIISQISPFGPFSFSLLMTLTARPRSRSAQSSAYANQSQLSLFDILPVLLSVNPIRSAAPAEYTTTDERTPFFDRASLFTLLATGLSLPNGKKGKLTANLTALRLIREWSSNPRPLSEAERVQLTQYIGWGELSALWDETACALYEISQQEGRPATEEGDTYNRWGKTYGAARSELQTLLSETERAEAALSTVNAFYTSEFVIRAIWQIVARLGFTGGDILEPACGTGHFIGLMPLSIREMSRVTAVEKDPLSAAIFSALYPEITTHNAGFETVRFEGEKENGAFDLIIGNVPFGDFKVYDGENRDLSAHFIHNYFISRSARLLRPGGLLALITTAGTMDSGGTAFRKALKEEGVDLVGAVRLPSCAFSENAGTEVTTDIWVMQKRPARTTAYTLSPFAAHTFSHLVSVGNEVIDEEADEIARTLTVNEYYAERPQMMLGRMAWADEVGKGGLYGADRQTLFLDNPAELAGRMQTAIESLPEGIYQGQPQPYNPLTPTKSRLNSFTKAVTIKKRLYKQSLIITQYENLKTAFRDLLSAEMAGKDDSICDALRQELNQQYREFTRHFGTLNRNRCLSFLEEWDSQFASVQALENVSRTDKTVTKAAIFTERVYTAGSEPDKVETLNDALQLSFYATGGIALPYMAQKLGKAPEWVRAELLRQELAYSDPNSGKLVERGTYLSGEVRDKLRAVESILVQQPVFTPNYKALLSVLPAPVPISLICFQLGSVWMPKSTLIDFITETLDLSVQVDYSPIAKEYQLTDHKGCSAKNEAAGTKERKGIDLVEAALNNRSIVVTKTVYVEGEKKEVKDVEATSAAVQAQEALQEQFTEFCRERYSELIETVFNDRFNNFVPKTYSVPTVGGQPLAHYPGANPAIKLRQHQFKAAERIKDEDTMLAHVVGSGKTWSMISAAMELKRLGRVSKTIIAVQNSTVADFGKAWKKLYPSAFVYVPDKSDLEASNRKRFLHRIATNNFDGIILPASFLKLIPDDPTDEEAFIQTEVARMGGKLDHLAPYSKKREKTVKQINKAKLRVQARRKAQADRKRDQMLHFGQLGIDCLMIDECHSKKRLGFTTNRRNIKGIDTQGSQDAFQALVKCRTVQRKGGRAVLATGTPISNTMAEAWTMLRFIAPDRLNRLMLDTFDGFAGAFGQIIPSFELTTSGQFKAVDRFAKFVNVPQLSALYRAQVDVVMNDDIEEFKTDNSLPQLKNGAFTSVILLQTPGVAAELAHIRSVLRWYEKLPSKDKKDNCHIPLVMFGQARKATLDIRLLSASNPDEGGSKTNVAVGNILAKYRETDSFKGTQLVFADLFRSPAVTDAFLDEDGRIANPDFGCRRFNLFTDIKAKLVQAGIPESEVAIVPDDANKREPIFEKVRTGEIRVMLGTSERMGVGVNVQDRLAAIHHLDAPARPTDFEQRNGRGIRQGNLLALWGIALEIFTYGVDKTLDATAYGRMAIKKKFINQVLQGNMLDATMADISAEDDFMSMSFEGMMATLSGSQHALTYTIQNHELSRVQQQKKNWSRGLMDAQARVEKARFDIGVTTRQLPQLSLESDLFTNQWGDGGITEVVADGLTYREGTGIDGWTAATERLFLYLQTNARRGRLATGSLAVNGLTFGLEVGLTGYTYNGKPEYGINYQWGLSLKGTVSCGAGFYTSLRASVNDVLDAPARAKAILKRAKSEETEFGLKVNITFKKQGELERLEKEVAALKVQMEQETAENE